MALKKKVKVEVKAAAAKAVKKPPTALTAAQKVFQALKKDKKFTSESEVLFDPDAPLDTATHWIQMPHPWKQLTGTPGVPFGQVTTIQGKPDSGKTTIAMHSMVEAQEQGFNVVLIDTEHKFNRKRLRSMGGDLTNYFHVKCDTIEEGFDAIDRLLVQYAQVSEQPVLFVWDSLGQTPTDEEFKGDARKITVASAAKVIKKNLRRIRSKLARTNSAVVFINHVYDNINALFGNSVKGYGGNGAYFASSLCLEVQRIRNKEVQTDKVKRVIGIVSGIKCTKNHLSDVQGGKAQMVIGSTGIEADSVTDLKGKGDDGIDDIEDLDLDDIDTPMGPKARTKNGREVSL